ncbi:cellulase family glycosylhydrolase [Paraburkholderia sp. G-4-1-8]|uniref:Cellulase family glycosylhydrolase n=2 Tax=Paraburkholderia antibiotica TaxID=2728839 RepID=A0A7X9ZVU5_9BURK|nr:cellulase family glycosylhydrolase [Paraburkholderia antibiotica]
MFCAIGAAHAQEFQQWTADSGSARIGTQVKVERFDSESATRIKVAGFSFVRFGVWVDAMQSANYRAQVAHAFTTARSAGLPVLLTVRSTRPLSDHAAHAAADDATLRSAADQLVRTVNELTRAYGSDMLALELWNEPDLSTYWPTGQVEKTFPVYMNAVCAGLKANHAAVPVIGFGFSRAPVAGTLPDKLLRSVQPNSTHCLDAVSYHAYGMSAQQIQQAARYIRAQYGLPALITEWGVSSGSRAGVDGQAERTGAFLAKRNSIETPLISIYEWQDTTSAKNARERNFGLVDGAGTAKRALDAASTALQGR